MPEVILNVSWPNANMQLILEDGTHVVGRSNDAGVIHFDDLSNLALDQILVGKYTGGLSVEQKIEKFRINIQIVEDK